MVEYRSIIAGQQHSSGQWIEARNPFTLEILGRVTSVDKAATEETIRHTWAGKITLSRHQILNKMAERLKAVTDTVSRVITSESGLSLKSTQTRLPGITVLQDNGKARQTAPRPSQMHTPPRLRATM